MRRARHAQGGNIGPSAVGADGYHHAVQGKEKKVRFLAIGRSMDFWHVPEPVELA